MVCGSLNWPGPLPLPPHSATNRPSSVKWTTRLLRAVAMAVGHEQVAVGGLDDVGRLVEEVGPGAAHPGLAQPHQHLAVGAELDRLVALAAAAAGVGHPQVAAAIHRAAVREVHQALAEAAQQPPGAVEDQDRRLVAAFAGVVHAAVDDEDLAVGRRLDGGHGRPLHARRQLAPVAGRAVGLRQVVARLAWAGCARR